MPKASICDVSKLNLGLWFSILNSYTPNQWGDLEDESYSQSLMERASERYKRNRF